MTIIIEDVKKININEARTEEEKIQLIVKKIKIYHIWIKDIIKQINLADGYKLKVIDLRDNIEE